MHGPVRLRAARRTGSRTRRTAAPSDSRPRSVPAPPCRRSRACRRCSPADHLWPIDDVWKFHAGGDEFKDLKLFTEALDARYGKADERRGLRAQGAGARLRGPARDVRGLRRATSTRSTGVIQWMLNNAWPSMIWHLYDYYLRPGRRLLRHQEGVRAAARPVLLRRPLDRRRQRSSRSVLGASRSRPSLRSDLTQKFSQRGHGRRRRGRGRPRAHVPDAHGSDDHLLPAPHARRGRGRRRQHELLLAVDAARTCSTGRTRSGSTRRRRARRPDGARAACRRRRCASTARSTGRAPRSARSSRSRTRASRSRFKCT